MIKIKVSYERPEELRKVLERLKPYVKSWKASRDQKGRDRFKFCVNVKN